MPRVESGNNEISGDVSGLVVQARNIHGDLHINRPPVHVQKPPEFLKAVNAVIVAGVLFGLTASSPPVGAVVAVDPPVGITVASSPIPTTTTLPPTPVTFAPVVASTSRPTAESPPATTAAVPTAEPEHRYTSAPDLTGAWELDFTLAGAEKPDRYTITLKRLADTRCGGNPPCYGGQWFYGSEARSNTGVMWASPAPIGFTAVDTSPEQTYRGTVVEDDTRRPLSYMGTWIGDGGKHATFVFTRVA